MESFWVPERNPVTTSMAADAIRVIIEALGPVMVDPDDITARGWLLFGAYRAGVVLASAGTALHHRASHVLGGRFGLDHAGMNSALLPHVVAYNSGWGSWDAAELDAAVGDQPAERLFDLAVAVGAPTSLAQLGMPEDGIEMVIAEIVGEVGATVTRGCPIRRACRRCSIGPGMAMRHFRISEVQAAVRTSGSMTQRPPRHRGDGP